MHKINSLEEYEQKISSENPKVAGKLSARILLETMGDNVCEGNMANLIIIVIDYHLEWCGPCEVIEPNFR